jgi:DNA ligase (NAD+)
MPVDGFEKMNAERARNGEPIFATPRNSAAGALRQLDPAVTANRPLRFFGYGIAVAPGSQNPAQTQWDYIQLLAQWGIPTAPHGKLCDSLREVVHVVHQVESGIRESLNFAIDGVVVKVNSLALQDELGVVGGREPRWAIARKFAPDIAVTKLLDIRVNVGRTGTINPYAVLEPVEIGGTSVRLATLHNEELIAKKDLRVGDWVQVKRAGDVIPQIIAPLPQKRDGSQKPWRMPDNCPECGTLLTREMEEVALYCTNAACPGRRLEALVHFASREAMDIRGLSYQRIQQMVQASLVKNFADLYELQAEQLRQLDRFAEKSSEALIAAIEESKSRPLEHLVFALGINHVGLQNARLLARHFGSLDALRTASTDEIASVRGIGQKIAEAIRAFFGNSDMLAVVRRLHELGLNVVESEGAQPQSGILRGKVVVITGTLPTLSRGDATKLVESAGGKVTSAVTKKTHFVVAGDSPGGKLDKARALGIETIDEDELRRRLSAEPSTK